MSPKFQQTKSSFLEGGLPCASLSAECQRDNNARQRPPQNRLHIWWARRPPTISRAAILAALLPFDLDLDESVLPSMVEEPSEKDIDSLPAKFQNHENFFRRLLNEVRSTSLTREHSVFLRAMGITGDSDRAVRRMMFRENYLIDKAPILIPMNWTYRHISAFRVTPSYDLVDTIRNITNEALIDENIPITILDYMAGGGSIPLESLRYGFKTYANDLNPVAAITLKATIEYPAKYGNGISSKIRKYVDGIVLSVKHRLS